MFRKRTLTRLFSFLLFSLLIKLLFFSSSASNDSPQIRRQGVLDLVAGSDKLDVHKYDFLQVRIGRDERKDLFDDVIDSGLDDFWERYQKPFITDKSTAHIDQQNVVQAVEQLLTLNGWVAALCPVLSRPFGQSDNTYDTLTHPSSPSSSQNLYFIGLVIHSADHFLVDQLAVIVQLARRLGTQNVFVSMLDYDSSDSTETLLDLSEAVLTLLGIPFRIRKVPPMTEEPTAAYYPLEEAHTRNLVLEPLFELYEKRHIVFHRVIWLKGFTCPNDILETITVSTANNAAMVCGMDWAEHNGFFIFSDRWRTRDINGDQFRQSKSSAAKSKGGGPARDSRGAERYAEHLPFQVFCCESGTHVVDPGQTYYEGIRYRAGAGAGAGGEYVNLSRSDVGAVMPRRDPDAGCLDSSQAHFCRDLWVRAAREGMREVEMRTKEVERGNKKSGKGAGYGFNLGFGWGSGSGAGGEAGVDEVEKENQHIPAPIEKRDIPPLKHRHAKRADEGGHAQRQRVEVDIDANAGSDFDAMPDDEDEFDSSNSNPNPDSDSVVTPDDEFDVDPDADGEGEGEGFAIPNSVFRPARILVNPRCVTTYAGVSHAQLALDLFGDGSGSEKDEGGSNGEEGWREKEKYVLDDWEGAPETFSCQEQKFTGGRKAPKTQRRLAFSIQSELDLNDDAGTSI